MKGNKIRKQYRKIKNCEICSKPMRSDNLKRHKCKLSNKDSTKINCNICKKDKDKYYVKIHTDKCINKSKKIPKKLSYKCRYCNKLFKKYRLESHENFCLRKNNNDKSNKCIVLNKSLENISIIQNNKNNYFNIKDNYNNIDDESILNYNIDENIINN